jgi:hypothetical protein
MSDLKYADFAVGPCIQCGEESNGSNYWIGMPQQAWDVIKKVIEPMYPVSPHSGVRLVTAGRWFFLGLDKPLCGPECALKHGEDDG